MPQVSDETSESDRKSVGGKTYTSGGEEKGSRHFALEIKLQPELPDNERREALIKFVEERENEEHLLQLWLESLRRSFPKRKFKQVLLMKMLHCFKVIVKAKDGDGNVLDLDHSSLTKEVVIIANDLHNETDIIHVTILLLRDALLSSLVYTGVTPLTAFHLDSTIVGPAIQSAFQLFSKGILNMEFEVKDFFPDNRITAAIVTDADKTKLVDDLTSLCDSNHVDWKLFPVPETSSTEDHVLFHKADLAIIDISTAAQRQSLFYQIGVRESYGQLGHILITNRVNSNDCSNIRESLPNTDIPCIAYNYDDSEELSQFLQQVQNYVKQIHTKLLNAQEDNFVALLRKAREALPEKQHSALLGKITERLLQDEKEEENQGMLTPNTILNLLLSFRETQDYDAMINLVDKFKREIPQDAKNNKRMSFEQLSRNPLVIYLYAFALNRRNQENDREKALKLISEFVPIEEDESSPSLCHAESRTLDLTCLCGRIYKDKFIDSNYTDKTSLNLAIRWYRRAYQLPQLETNEIAISGINLMTLLVVSGVTFSSSTQYQELQSVGLTLNYLIGKKGKLSSLRNYWDLATLFELSILTEDWSKAGEALELMLILKPSHWCIKSTLRNVTLILNQQKGECSKNNHDIINTFVDRLEQFLNG